MTKIHIVTRTQQVIEGFKKVEVMPNFMNLVGISNNECETIMANEVLDSFSLENIPKCIQELTSKLRLNGTLVIGGTDMRIFCRGVINGTIPATEGAKIVETKLSMTTLPEIMELIKSTGLKIETSTISGAHYEIVATRS